MTEQTKTPTGLDGGTEPSAVKVKPFTQSVPQAGQSGKNSYEVPEPDNVAEEIGSAPAFLVPEETKAAWLKALGKNTDKMVDVAENGSVALAPVPAGQTVLSIAPVEWLGTNMMIYVPEKGHWASAEALLTQVLTEFAPTLKLTFGLPQVRQIIDHAKVLTPGYLLTDQPNRAEIDAKTWDARPYITFENGDLYVPTMQLGVHAADHRTTWHVPFDWDPKATSTKLDQFLESAIPDAISRKNLLAFIGYSLAKFDTSQHQFMYLLGSGRNGKSLLLKLITRALGPHWSNVSLGKLTTSKFAASSLVSSVLNLVGDQDAVFLASTELIKEYSGFDAIDVERKFRDSYPYIAKTKFMFAVNELPRTRDTSYGFFRRPLIVEFPRRFAQNPDYEDSLLGDDQVVRALLVQSITAYQEMRDHKGFWIEGRVQELLDEYRSENDVVFAAVQDGLLLPDAEHHILPWALTPIINLFANERENQKLSQSQILKKLKNAGIAIEKKRESHGHREWYLTGITADPMQFSRLIHRSGIYNPDGTETVVVGGKRYSVPELFDAWGIDDPAKEIRDPDIAQAMQEGGSARI